MSVMRAIKSWRKAEDGVALMETAMLFPVLLLMIFGVYDVGHAITVNHKMITASQMVADLITRKQVVTTADIDDSIVAARLALQPYASSATDFGIDIVSVEFDENDEPRALWRETRNMAEDSNLVLRTTGLGTDGEGVVAVTLSYRYRPTFGNMVIEEFGMRETAFARGRRSPTVSRE